jgi:DNA mismatch repair protein MutL
MKSNLEGRGSRVQSPRSKARIPHSEIQNPNSPFPTVLAVGRITGEIGGLSMGKIRVLPDEVASQVAAGEVVERPASLVKELVENSLDAGAGRIVIEYARGGSRLVAVRDDGCGMDREDALLCLERHATSKIRTGADLTDVRTMGFRGEAVPSIASVSRFRLVTREPDSEAGTEILVAGGKIETVRETGTPPGTQIEVRDLFYNLPARRKFLRGEETESAHILQSLHGTALANPGVAFECRRDGKAVLTLPRAESLAVRIKDLLGAGHLARMVEIEPVIGEGFRVAGFLARPGQGRRDRLQQFVILNGRPIVCPAVQQPLREAYAGALERGEHPLSVLLIDMKPDLVDCNVHPAKREVRLRFPDALRQAVFDAGRKALAQGRAPAPVARQPLPQARPIFVPAPPQPELPVAAPPPIVSPAPDPARSTPLPVSPPGEKRTPTAEPAIPPETPAPPVPLPPAPEDRFRLLGLMGEGYLVLEGDEGLVLVDTRAAAERIYFEALMRQIDDGNAPCQRLLMPVVTELPVREHAWVVDHIADLEAAGFLIEPFGGASLKIEGLPASAGEQEPERLLHEIASALRAAGKLPRGRGMREALARSVSRIAAEERFRGGDERARGLVRELLRCELPYAAPSGRPTMIQFSFAELDRKFGRA